MTTIWKAFRRLGVRYKKRQTYREADPGKRAEFTEFIEKQDKSKLVFIDESGIDKYLYRRNCRALKGKQVYGAVSGRKFERVSIVAGKCGKDIIAPFGYTGTCNSKLFLIWIQKALLPNLKKNQIVIMDNASIHKSQKIKEAFENAGCTLVYQPPYSPDLNPIGHAWAHIKRKIAALQIKLNPYLTQSNMY